MSQRRNALTYPIALVAKLVYARDLKSLTARYSGSTPDGGTMKRDWGDYKITSIGHPCHTMANITGVADDRHNRFRELPFWLRIGPINWRNTEVPYGWMLGFDDYDDD